MATYKLEAILQQLQDPVPQLEDPENLGDVTGACLAAHVDKEDEDEAAWQQQSLLRRRAADSWDGIGKRTSRKDLYESSEDDSTSGMGSKSEEENPAIIKEDEEGEEEEMEEGMFDEDGEEDGNHLPSDEEIESDLSDDEDDGGGDGDGQDDDEEISSSEIEDEGDDTVMQNTAPEGGEKAEAVIQQLDLWDRLMEVRIQLQKTLSCVNKLPTENPHQESPHLPEARDALCAVGCSLCELHETTPSSPKKRKADIDVEELASQAFESLQTERNTSLTFWDEKTRLASKKFKSFKSYQTPILKQVEQILSDRDRLVRRTQVHRDSEAADQANSDKPGEIFDDNDFYQRLLKSLIENKADEESSISASASQWLEVQKLRGKKNKKKDIDTRASKGRKLRYNVHNKLVNFMAPRDDSTWSEDAKSELFKNLFKMPSFPEI